MKEENNSGSTQQKQTLGITSKQRVLYQEIFLNFSQDGQCISAIDFFKVCKILRVYPVIISFDQLKKVVLRNPDYWCQKKGSTVSNNEINGTLFYFKDFVKAFKIIAKLGYKNIDDSTNARFLQLSNYLRKQFTNYSQKQEKMLQQMDNLNSETRSIQSYETYQTGVPPNPGQLQRHQYSNSSASYKIYQIQQPQKTISPNHAYYEATMTPQDKQSSLERNNGQFSAKFVSTTLSNEYRGRTGPQQQQTGGDQRVRRYYVQDNKSEVSTRPMSKAYSAVRGNPKIAQSLMIPKVKLKKKGLKQPNINSFLTLKQGFKDHSSYSVSQTCYERKPSTAQQFVRAKLKNVRNSNKSPTDSQTYIQPALTSKVSVSNDKHAAIFQTVADIERQMQNESTLKREEKKQQMFRIRKYSRSSSRASSARGSNRDEQEIDDNNTEEKNKKTIETPPDLSSFNDIKNVNLNLKEKFKKGNFAENKFKMERDLLIDYLKQIKKVFKNFQQKSEETHHGKDNLGDTGHFQKDDLLLELSNKDERIRELEEEVKRLKQREYDLVQKLENQN